MDFYNGTPDDPTENQSDVVDRLATSPQYTWFQASRQGNGIGVSVIARVVRNSPDDPGVTETVVVHILPKFWRTDDSVVRYLVPFGVDGVPSNLEWTPSPSARHVVEALLFEKDWMALPKGDWKPLTEKPDDEGGNQDEDQGTEQSKDAGTEQVEEGASDPLWSEQANPLTGPHEQFQPYSLPDKYEPKTYVEGMWAMIDHAKKHNVLRESILGEPLLLDLPELRPVLLRLFLEKVEDAVYGRKPHFTLATEELYTVRGRLPVRELIRRRALHRLPVWCEFDDLTADVEMWQGIRQAVLACATDSDLAKDEKAVDLALTCDAQLQDVSIVPPPEILAQADRVTANIKDRTLQDLHRLAMAVLRHELNVASTQDYGTGVLVNIKVPTSDVWEDIIRQYLKLADYACEADKQDCPVFSKGNSKKPDIDVLPDLNHGGLVIDAKYKKAPRNWGDIVDQYQAYAYARIREMPVFLVYPGPAGVVKNAVAWAYGKGKSKEQVVGAACLPFPEPDEPMVSASQEVRDAIEEMYKQKP